MIGTTTGSARRDYPTDYSRVCGGDSCGGSGTLPTIKPLQRLPHPHRHADDGAPSFSLPEGQAAGIADVNHHRQRTAFYNPIRMTIAADTGGVVGMNIAGRYTAATVPA